MINDPLEDPDDIAAVPLTRNRAPGQSPGEILREARLAHDYSIEDLCAQTRLPLRTVHALEDDDFESLSQPVFARGYYRQCAKVLDIDSDRLMAAYAAASGESAPRAAAPSRVHVVPQDVTPGSRRRSFGLIGGLLILLIAAAAVYVFMDDVRLSGDAGRSGDTGSNTMVLSGNGNDNGGQASGSETETADHSNAGAAAGQGDSATDTAADGAPAAGPAAAGGASAAADSSAAPNADSRPSGGRNVNDRLKPNNTAGQADESAQSAGAPAVDPAHLELTFTDRSWVDVRGADGERLLTGIFDKGETKALDGKPPYKITLGFAPGVEMTIGGQPVDVAAQTRDNATARMTVDAPDAG